MYTDAKAPTSLKILTYNIHKGFTHSNRKYVLNQIREGIREVDADLVFLQEVIGLRNGGVSKPTDRDIEAQFEYLADEVWPHFAYGKNAIYEDGHHGNAILSKYPIESFFNLNISTNRWERRGLLHAKVRVSLEQSFDAFALHLNLLGKSRLLQIEQVCRYISREISAGQPVVLGGDFNDWQKKLSINLKNSVELYEAHRKLHGDYAKTFPSRVPFFCLDRVYCRGFEPIVSRVLTGGVWNKLSDHLPLYVELKI